MHGEIRYLWRISPRSCKIALQLVWRNARFRQLPALARLLPLEPSRRERRDMATAMTTRWQLKGQGYEYCNCDFGCGCNFGGVPNSEGGSCRALVGHAITEGRCGDVDLSGVRCAMIAAWPKAIHEGNGKAVFIV